MAEIKTYPKSFGILLYPGFEALDAFGPLEVLNDLSRHHAITLSVIAASRDPVSTLHPSVPAMATMVGQQVVPTHTFGDAPALDVLLVPGGQGGFEVGEEVLAYLRKAAAEASSVLTVCNGSAVAATAGVLDGRRATTNKAYWKECTAKGPKVNWIAKARWVHDGKFWTSSGVSAGIDAILAWVEATYGKELADSLANNTEFIRAKNADDDPFTELYNCKDVPAQ